jgi:hypothetical protein
MKNSEARQMIEARIRNDIKHFNGKLPERYVLAWQGYVAGAFEWGTLEPYDYSYLVDLLPKVEEPNPILEIFEGRDDDDE